MSNPHPTVQRPAEPPTRRCPACGQPLTRLSDGRCNLCGLQIDERPITSEDSTPFAKPENGKSASSWAMCKWIFGISGQRLSFLGLMRPSAASNRFARTSLAWFAVAVASWQFQAVGWRMPKPHLMTESSSMLPNGSGWYQIAEVNVDAAAAERRPSSLWWNPPVAVIAVSTSFLVALLLGWLWFACAKGGAVRSLPEAHRQQGRLGSALHYGMAWVRPAAWILMLLALKPLTDLAWVKGWGGPELAAFYSIGIWSVVAVWLILWWIWLIRLSLTVPPQSRTRSMFWWMLGAPLLSLIFIVGPLWGLQWAGQYLFPMMNLGW